MRSVFAYRASRLSALCLSFLIGSAVLAAEPPTLHERVSDIISKSGVTGGFVVHLGIKDSDLTWALRHNDRYQIHGLDREFERVLKVRDQLKRNGHYGPISVDQLVGDRLPYIDNLVNLIVVGDQSGISNEEIMRVLTPGGVVINEWGQHKRIKQRSDQIDDWTHFLHDASGNAVAHDNLVGPPRHLQWLGSPRWSRHHDRMASMSALVSEGGRIFYIMDEGSRISIQMPPKWTVVARDAFNGTILWKQPIPNWHSHLWPLKSGPTQLARRLVAADGFVFVTLGIEAPLTAIDAATGNIIRTYEETKSTEEILYDNGQLLLLVNKGKSDLLKYKPLNPVVGDQGDVGRNWRWNEKPVVLMAVDAKSGKTQWSRSTRIAPLSLTADRDRVYFHDGEKVVAAHRADGSPAWSSEPAARRRIITYNFGPRIVVHKDIVLYAGGERTMKAFDSKSGDVLWTAPHDRSGYQSPEDLLVVGGLVWSAPTTSGRDTGNFTGRDVRTGEVKVTFPPNVEAYWFHHRCYIAKATDRFIIPSRTGIEFVDPTKKDWNINHWVRGGCLYGVMPCNGLLYAPPHNCACYPEAKLYGFNALAPTAPSRESLKPISEEKRLEKGPAFARVENIEAGEAEWPTYRHDRTRSGSTSVPVAGELATKWKEKIGGRLTSVVVSGGKLFVASIDDHTVHALDEQTGKEIWSFTAGGRVDSPPTIDSGCVYFGSNDGWIYCLRASDGEVAWRYLAAPLDRRLMAFEQLESVWPVHGSVLVQNGSVFAVAGRSNFLDGGLRFLRLDATSGSLLAEASIDEVDPTTGKHMQTRHQVLQMPVGLPDILTSDGESVYMKSQRLNQDGKRFDIGPNSADFAGQAAVHEGKHAHLFAPMGFLDDTWFHRAYWVYGRSFAGGHAGYYQAGRFAPSGRLLVFDDDSLYGFGRKPEHLRWTTVLEHQLFSAPKVAPDVPESAKARRRGQTGGSSAVRIANSKKIDPTGKSVLVDAWVYAEKPNGVVLAHGGPLNGYSLFLQGGKPRFAARVGEQLHVAAGKESVAKKWTRLTGVLTSDNQVVLFVNDIKAASAKAGGLIPKAPAQSIEIGADEGSAVGEYKTPNGFTGVIDEVQVLHGSFTLAQVEEKLEQEDGRSQLDAKTVFASGFKNGKARDTSGLNNHGTIVKATPADGKVGPGLRFTARAGNARPSGSFVKPHWTKDVPLLVRAMVKAQDTLFIAGPPDLIDEAKTFEFLKAEDPTVQKLLAEQDAALNGSQGAVLRAISARDGSTLNELRLKSLPVWDGMAAANGRLYLATRDGEIICFAELETAGN